MSRIIFICDSHSSSINLNAPSGLHFTRCRKCKIRSFHTFHIFETNAALQKCVNQKAKKMTMCTIRRLQSKPFQFFRICDDPYIKFPTTTLLFVATFLLTQTLQDYILILDSYFRILLFTICILTMQRYDDLNLITPCWYAN